MGSCMGMFVSFLSKLIPLMAFSLEMYSDRYVSDPIDLCLSLALAVVIVAAAIFKVFFGHRKVNNLLESLYAQA